MICKIISGRGFGGCVAYYLQKVEQGTGELLFSGGVGENKADMIADFEPQASLRGRVRNVGPYFFFFS